MLSAQSTRDLNQAARSASKYLRELGFELPHAKALDLVARLVGKPHHMASQAGLPAATASGAGATPGSGQSSVNAAIEDLCKVLVHRDVEQALYDEGVSDAANAALAQAVPFVSDAVLADFSLDALRQAYEDLPVAGDEEVFFEQARSWGLTPEQYAKAERLANALYAGKRQRAEELSTDDSQRLLAQAEIADPELAKELRQYMETRSGLASEVLRYANIHLGLSLSLGPWVIRNEREEGYWSNGFGWTSSRWAATGYPDEVANSTPVQALCAKYGSYIRWIRFEDAVDYSADVSSDLEGTAVPEEEPPVRIHKSQGHPLFVAECVRVSHGHLDVEVEADSIEDAVQQALDKAYDTVFSMDDSDWFVSLLNCGGEAQSVPPEFTPPEPMSQSSFAQLVVPAGRCRFELSVTREAFAYATVHHVLRPDEDLMDKLMERAGSASSSDKTSEYFVEVVSITRT